MKISIRVFSLIILFQLVLNCIKLERNPLHFLPALVTQSGQPSTQLPPPIFSPTPGLRSSLSDISIFANPPDASIYYTTNGSTPTTSSSLYSDPIANVFALAGKPIQAFAVKSGYRASQVSTAVYSYPPPKTYSYTIHSLYDDGYFKKGLPIGFISNGDGTLKEISTGLIWQRCSAGQTNDYNCSGTATALNWSSAWSYCSSLTLAGKTWRLPDFLELATLVMFESPFTLYLNTFTFPGTANGAYWTSTTPLWSQTAWKIHFGVGSFSYDLKNNPHYVRCVSGSAKQYFNNFADNGDGTIQDKVTGLIWQKCSYGQIDDSICSSGALAITWNTALNYCNSLTLAGKTWRLPNLHELMSLVNLLSISSPRLNTTVFPNTTAYDYWSSTTKATSPSKAWYINFGNGTSFYKEKTHYSYVRCVSGGI